MLQITRVDLNLLKTWLHKKIVNLNLQKKKKKATHRKVNVDVLCSFPPDRFCRDMQSVTVWTKIIGFFFFLENQSAVYVTRC